MPANGSQNSEDHNEEFSDNLLSPEQLLFWMANILLASLNLPLALGYTDIEHTHCHFQQQTPQSLPKISGCDEGAFTKIHFAGQES